MIPWDKLLCFIAESPDQARNSYITINAFMLPSFAPWDRECLQTERDFFKITLTWSAFLHSTSPTRKLETRIWEVRHTKSLRSTEWCAKLCCEVLPVWVLEKIAGELSCLRNWDCGGRTADETPQAQSRVHHQVIRPIAFYFVLNDCKRKIEDTFGFRIRIIQIFTWMSATLWMKWVSVNRELQLDIIYSATILAYSQSLMLIWFDWSRHGYDTMLWLNMASWTSTRLHVHLRPSAHRQRHRYSFSRKGLVAARPGSAVTPTNDVERLQEYSR